MDRLWSVIAGIGGAHGWYGTDLGWWLRGLADVVVGGPGFRAGRRDPDSVVVGDQVDFWRVEAVEDGSMLRLYWASAAPIHGPVFGTLASRIASAAERRWRSSACPQAESPTTQPTA